MGMETWQRDGMFTQEKHSWLPITQAGTYLLPAANLSLLRSSYGFLPICRWETEAQRYKMACLSHYSFKELFPSVSNKTKKRENQQSPDWRCASETP